MAKIRFNQGFNVNNVVRRLVRTVLALYVGGTVLAVFGQVMACTESPFYTGLSLIGWTVGNANGSTAITGGTTSTCSTFGATVHTNVITGTTGSGVLAVVGIIAIAQIVTEFISW